MSLFQKKEKCVHHWHFIGKTTVFSDFGSDVSSDEMNALFCPKCEAETVVSNERWAQLQEIHKVREQYKETLQAESPASDVVIKPSFTERFHDAVTAKL